VILGRNKSYCYLNNYANIYDLCVFFVLPYNICEISLFDEVDTGFLEYLGEGYDTW